MKKTIAKYQRFRTLERIMEGHTEAFESRPEILEMKVSFTDALTVISNLISKLRQPVYDIFQQRMNERVKFKLSLKSMIAIALHYAVKIDNIPLIKLLTGYRTSSINANAYKMYDIGVNILGILTEHQTEMQGLGFTSGELITFTNELEIYNQSMRDANFQLNSRKNIRADLKVAMSLCETLVKGRLDTFVAHTANKYPALSQEYQLARVRKRRKRKPGDHDTGTADIMGTVYNSLTGKPIENATISLIELDYEVQTDKDGVFLLDELPAGNYTLTFSGSGYHVPHAVKVNLAAGESLVYDFTLIPLEQENEAA